MDVEICLHLFIKKHTGAMRYILSEEFLLSGNFFSSTILLRCSLKHERKRFKVEDFNVQACVPFKHKKLKKDKKQPEPILGRSFFSDSMENNPQINSTFIHCKIALRCMHKAFTINVQTHSSSAEICPIFPLTAAVCMTCEKKYGD